LSESLKILSQTYSKFNDDKAPAFAAALAFFATFSIAQIGILFVGIVSLVLGPSAAHGTLYSNLNRMVGSGAAQFIENSIQNTNLGGGSVWATVVGAVTLFISATAVMAQVKDALNTIWGIKPKSQNLQKSIWYIVWTRIVGFLLIILAGFLFLVFVAGTAALNSLGHYLSSLGTVAEVFVRIGFYVFFILLLTLFFAILYKYLPDAKIEWKNVWVGAFGTAVLFVIGTYLIGLYLGKVGVGSAFGAAGSLVLVLLWVFYSAQIFLFGAVFTQVYSLSRGKKIKPSDEAEQMITKNPLD